MREKGLQHTQIADVVRHAHTSRRTFYGCFSDKESACVELIREWSVTLRDLVESAVDQRSPWEEQIDAALDAHFTALSGDRVLVATVSRELPTVGERGAAPQHKGVERFAPLVLPADARHRDAARQREGGDPVGYMLGKDQQVKDVFAVQAELLRSEGIDPEWPRFNQADD